MPCLHVTKSRNFISSHNSGARDGGWGESGLANFFPKSFMRNKVSHALIPKLPLMHGQITPLFAPQFVQVNKTKSLCDWSTEKRSTIALALISFYAYAPQRPLQPWNYVQCYAAFNETLACREEQATQGVTILIIIAYRIDGNNSHEREHFDHVD